MWEVISHCNFDLHLSYDYWCWAPFHVSVGHAFFGKVFIQFICPLKKLYCLFFFSLSTPSSLFPSHNLLFSISLITIEYNTSIYLLLICLSLKWYCHKHRIFVCFVYCFISSLTHKCSTVCVQWMNEWTYIEYLLCIKYKSFT